ncbi:MAG: polymerase [Comamonadaceae bacterium]|nr:MAG: polymerase [Comamonadaceae bacterium]
MLPADGNPDIPPTPRTWLAAAATLALVLPWLNPFAPGPSPALVPWLVSLACGALVLLLSPFVTVQVICRAWLAAALISAVVGLIQYMGWAGPLYPWVNQTQTGEGFGNLRQRNQFATLLNIGMAVLVWHCASGHTPSRRARLLVAAAGCVLGIGIAASLSRTGLLQLVLLGVLGVVWKLSGRPGARVLFITAAGATVLASIALPVMAGLDMSAYSVFGRLAENTSACSSRVVLWSNVLHLISLRPWTGWGWGELDYAHFATLYPGDRFCAILDNAHNLPLHLAVELGIPVAVFVCVAAGWLVVRAKPWRETSPVRQLAWTVILVISVHSMLEYPLWYGPFMTAFVLGVCMLWLHPAGTEVRGPSRHARPALTATRQAAGFALLLCLCYVTWDYRRVSQIYTPFEARDPTYRDDTLNKVRPSWLFAEQVRFAELTMSPVSRANAPAMYALARASIHYSPEPAVAERLIESAVMLGRDDEAILDLARYKAAFPAEHAAWAQANLRAVQRKP